MVIHAYYGQCFPLHKLRRFYKSKEISCEKVYTYMVYKLMLCVLVG